MPPPDGQVGLVPVGDVVLESGAVIPDVVLAVQRWGETNADRSNVVLVEHALTGDSHVTGPAGDGHLSPGWWTGMVGPGAPLDTDRWCVVATNVLGGCSGSTGPSSPHPDGGFWGSRFPAISIRDQVEAERLFADAVGVDRFAAVVGGSMGGMRTLEWVVGHPDRVASALVLAVGARASADQIGTQTTQIAAITGDRDWHGGDYLAAGTAPEHGLAIARRIAHLTYRTEHELDTRFGNASQSNEDAYDGGRYAVQSYLEHQAAKLVRRFDAGSYTVLSEAMNRHDVGRGRGGVEAALRSVRLPVVVAGVDSDRLYPLRQQQQIADLIPSCDGLRIIESRDGHDGFLTEPDAVSALLIATMALADDILSAPSSS
ncbi:homoserine O-acetyltransferase MetX [Rhodococcus sp. NPDC003994]